VRWKLRDLISTEVQQTQFIQTAENVRRQRFNLIVLQIQFLEVIQTSEVFAFNDFDSLLGYEENIQLGEIFRESGEDSLRRFEAYNEMLSFLVAGSANLQIAGGGKTRGSNSTCHIQLESSN
jgi:hypothetical protein